MKGFVFDTLFLALIGYVTWQFGLTLNQCLILQLIAMVWSSFGYERGYHNAYDQAKRKLDKQFPNLDKHPLEQE